MNFIETDVSLLACPKKMSKVKQGNNAPTNKHLITEAMFYLEKKALENEVIQKNPGAFKDFIIRNVPEILRCFENVVQTKQ